MAKELKFRTTAFIRTKDEKVHLPADPISAQFIESEQGKTKELFERIKRSAKKEYGENFSHIQCIRVSLQLDDATYRIKAFLNIEHRYINLSLPVSEGDRDYSFSNFFEHLTEVGMTMHGEQFDGISYLKFFLLDEENIVVNYE